MAKLHPNLKGHSILLVESHDLLPDMAAHCLVKERMGRIDIAGEVPHNLVEKMDKRNLDCVIAHPGSYGEEEALLKAHRAGKNVVVIHRLPLTQEDYETAEKLREAGVPTVTKSVFAFGSALDLLSELISTCENGGKEIRG